MCWLDTEWSKNPHQVYAIDAFSASAVKRWATPSKSSSGLDVRKELRISEGNVLAPHHAPAIQQAIAPTVSASPERAAANIAACTGLPFAIASTPKAAGTDSLVASVLPITS